MIVLIPFNDPAFLILPITKTTGFPDKVSPKNAFEITTTSYVVEVVTEHVAPLSKVELGVDTILHLLSRMKLYFIVESGESAFHFGKINLTSPPPIILCFVTNVAVRSPYPPTVLFELLSDILWS